MEQAAFAFLTNGKPVQAEIFGHGHINHTLKVVTDTGDTYILQKINKYVFKDPVALMKNASAVTEFLRGKVERPENALEFIPTETGSFCYEDPQGEFWRMYRYVDGFCLEAPETPEDFYQSAIAFGRFQYQLADFPAETLTEIIPEFHNTIDRYRIFQETLARDPMGRAAGVQEEIRFLLDRQERAGTLQRMRESGELPLRVTHNDTKLNNVLLDAETREPLCVLDLDTVMPGLSAYDFGDSIRFGAATAAEDEKDLSKMTMDLDLYRVYTKGFVEACPSLTPEELHMLPMGAWTMTLEVGLRFLTDYLDGDHYFKTAYSDHNLVRSRTQLKLVRDMEEKWAEMEKIAAEVSESVR